MASLTSRDKPLSALIREMLLDGELSPGQPVRQEALARRFGVSRVPIREAMRVLETEGIVQHTPNAGYSITKLTASELDQTYLIRESLETALIRALPRIASDDLNTLRAINDEMAGHVKDGAIGAANVANRRFHFAIFGLAGLHLVMNFVEMAWVRAAPYHILVLSAPEQIPRIFEEHDRMLRQLVDHDIDGLLATMAQHREAGHRRVMHTLEVLRRHGRALIEAG